MTVIARLPNRYEKKASKQEGILNADVDNAYYQRAELLVNSSGALFRCVSTFSKFITGHGYQDTSIGNLIINRKGWTYNQLVQKRGKDFSRAGGWAIQINYNALYQEVELNYVPFKYCRLQIDKDENLTGKIVVYDDWGNFHRGKIKKEKIDVIDLYNPDTTVIQTQVDAAGGWDKYKGQIIWYSPEIDSYPVTVWDSEAESAEADFRIKRFKLRNISNGFVASYIYTLIGKMTEAQKDEKIEELEQFMGDENAGSMMVEFAEREEAAPKLQKVELQDTDNIFEWTSSDTYERIRKVFNVPPVLVGDLVAGKMGTAREFADAVNMYNNHTEEYRDLFQQWDKRILSYWNTPVTGTFEIKPLSSFTPVDIPTDLLKKMTDDEQRALIGLPPAEKKQQSVNDKLNSMSPLVATKVLDNMAPEEIREQLAGLPAQKPLPANPPAA